MRITSLIVKAARDIDNAGDVVTLCCIQDDSAAGLGMAQQAHHSLAMAAHILHSRPHILGLENNSKVDTSPSKDLKVYICQSPGSLGLCSKGCSQDD